MVPRDRSSGSARARARLLALIVAGVATALVVPVSLVLASEPPAPTGSGADPGAEQPSPPSGPVQPAPPSLRGYLTNGQPGPSDQVAAGHAQSGAPAARAATRSGVRARASASTSVSIVGGNPSSYAFAPKSITVHVGDRVQWANSSSAPEGHTVSGDGLDSGTLHQGDNYSHTFTQAGSFSYICAIHPFMKGKVTVLASSSGGSGGASTNSGSGGGGSSSSSGATGAGSESAAGSAPGAAGGGGHLPVTGLPLAPMAAVGAALVLLGTLLRRRAGFD